MRKEINRIQPSKLFDDLLTDEIREKFKTINFDILVGLTRQTPETMKKTIQEVVRIRPTEGTASLFSLPNQIPVHI